MFSAFQKKLTQLLGPLRIVTSGKTSTVLEVNTQSGNPANLLGFKVNGVDALRVDKNGNLVMGQYGHIISDTQLYFSNSSGPRLIIDFSGIGPISGVSGVSLGGQSGGAPWQNITLYGVVNFTSGSGSMAVDLVLTRDGTDTLAQRRAGNAQSSRLYGTYASATSYHRMGLYATAVQSLTATGASVATTTLIIPKYSQLIGVTTRVMTALGTTNGTTGYLVGDGTDADLWGAMTGTAVGTSSDAANYTALNALGPSGVDRTVTLTAVGGDFDGTGVIDVCAFYLRAEAD